MKAVIALAVFACVAAMVAASDYGYYKPGFGRAYNGISAAYNNAERQEAVNYRAEHIGRSSGTARYDGVPGTGLNFGYHGYGNHGNGYGNRGYGYDDHHDGY